MTQRFCLILGLNMQTTIIAYWVYQLTHDVLSLGKLGLFEAVPAITLSLISGHIIDQREKRKALLACILAYLALSAYFLSVSYSKPDCTLQLIYGGIAFGGAARAFVSPASFTILGLLVPRKHLQNAATWSSASWQLGAILGPLVGGFSLAALHIFGALWIPLILVGCAALAVSTIPVQPILKKSKEPVLQSLREGLRFISGTQIILAVLLLDMFAVLLGGATALLPAYAEDVLHVSSSGFGWLRAAPGIGAIVMFMILAVFPLKKKPGIKLLAAIGGYGLCIIVFGRSTDFRLSFAVLLLSGALDGVSVVVRGIILQLYTPDEMRGRVSAVNTMFISSSNELGELESGLTAKWLGLQRAVIIGGCATVMVVSGAWALAPRLRKLKF